MHCGSADALISGRAQAYATHRYAGENLFSLTRASAVVNCQADVRYHPHTMAMRPQPILRNKRTLPDLSQRNAL